MESMQAKLAAGNRYDLIFPSAQWVRAADRGPTSCARSIRRRWTNARAIFDHYDYFADPWYDPKLGHSIPFTMYKTGHRLAQGQAGRRADRQLGRPLERDGQGQDRSCSTTATRCWAWSRCCWGCRSTPPTRTTWTAIVDELDSAAALPPRGFSSDDYNNLLAGDAWLHQTWSGDMAALLWQADDPSHLRLPDAERGLPGQLRRLRDPARCAQHPGTALLFIDYMLRPENVEKNIN